MGINVRRLKYQKKLEDAKRSPSTVQAGDDEFTIDLRSISEPGSPRPVEQFEFEQPKLGKPASLRLSLPHEQKRMGTQRKLKLENTMSCPAGSGSPDQYLPSTPRELKIRSLSQDEAETKTANENEQKREDAVIEIEESAKDNHENKFGYVLNMLVAQGVYSRTTVNSMQQIRNLHMNKRQASSSPGTPTAKIKSKILRMIQE